MCMQSVAVVQRAIRKQDPALELEEMGFGKLVLVGSFAVSMSGLIPIVSATAT